MATDLNTLLVAQSVSEIYQILLGVYQANGFPVQSWQTGGVERTRLMAIATAISDVSAGYIPQIAAGGYRSLAALLDTPDWIRLLAEENYNIEYNRAAFTEGDMLFTVESGSGPYNLTAGSMFVTFGATGNRYVNVNAETISSAAPVTVEMRAEFAGASYADPSNSGSITLVTALPGVSVTNPADDYSEVTHTGSGTGSLTLGGTPVGNHQVLIQIETTGTATTMTWSYSLDGAPYVQFGSGDATDLGGTGINITFVNGLTGTSFVDNDTFLFTTPGSWITQAGADDESAAALAERCGNRWSSLSPIPVVDFYELMVTSTPDVGSQVTQVIVLQDSVINNRVNIIVAGPAGALPAGTISDIQDYIDPRVPITDSPVVLSPTELEVTIAANVTVQAGLLTAAQDAIEAALIEYVYDAGINGTLRIAAIIDLVMEVAGVIDCETVTINGDAANLTMGSSTSFVIADLQELEFTYVTV